MHPPRTVPACLAIVIAFVSVASSTTKTGNNSRRAPNTASSFEDWIAAPANFHSSFDPGSPDNLARRHGQLEQCSRLEHRTAGLEQ
jgi:hypothetical protein